jgi:hypothetical protein
MSQRTTLVQIPQPCHERWEAMTPTTTGRHCAACQKTVVDFTHKTDAEILASLRQAVGETCGRLRADQLSRPLLAPTPAPNWRLWLGAALALGGVLGASRAAAQARESYYAGPRPAATNLTTSPRPGNITTPELATEPPTSSRLVTLHGTVTDSATHEGVPGVTVLLKGTTTGTSTDASGTFTLSVEASGTPVQLIINSVGYVTQQQVATAGQPLAIALVADTRMLLGEVVTIGAIDHKRPWPWHPRRFFNWSKYWLMKPFRD